MLIINALIIDEKTEKIGCVRIKDGKIIQINSTLKPQKNETVINGEGKMLLPGAIDINTGLGDTSQIVSAIVKVQDNALIGGVTTIAIMPDVAVNSEVGFDYFASKAKEVGKVSTFIAASTTENNIGDKLNNLSLVFKEGAIGVHSTSDLNSDFIKCASRYASMHNKTWFVRAQNKLLDAGAQVHDGKAAFELGLTGFSKLSETSEIAKICEYARDAEAIVVLESISSQEALEAGLRAKKSGVNALLQASLPNLLLSDNACLGFNSYAKIYPPLRDAKDLDALINACADGGIDIISSAHRPISSSKKEVAFDSAIFGIESLQGFWSLAYTALGKIISMKKLCALVASNPAKAIGLNDRGYIKVGMRADMVLFDYSAKNECFKNGKSPYKNLEINGKVVQTFSAENIVW